MTIACFAERLAALPTVTHIARLELFDAEGNLVGTIENCPGTSGSVAVYHAVSRPQGRLDPAAATCALGLYAEHVQDARAHSGKHPNIDRLLYLIATGTVLQVREVFA